MLPGAVADREAAAYAVVGAPLDASTSFRPGARFGPRRIREFGEQFDDYDHHTARHFTDLGVYDHGDIGPSADTAEYLTFLASAIAEFQRDGIVPLSLGGEHTVTVAAVRALDPDVFVCADAHLDLREEYAGDELSHATVTRHALSVADRAVVLGARTGSEAEWERASEGDVTVVPPEAVADWSPALDGESIEDRGPVVSVAVRGDSINTQPIPRHREDGDDGQAATLAAKLLRAFVFAHADGYSDD